MSELIRKSYEIKAEDASLSGDGSGSLVGSASGMGGLDLAAHCIFPTVYTPILTEFNRDGFVALNHDVWALPIGYPTLTEERGRQLYTEFTFHSTPEAQAVRTVCKERLDAKKSVGLSVGFYTEYEFLFAFESGANLLTFAQNNGYNMALFDTAGLRAWDDWCLGITKISKLREYSVTPMPCNLEAQATGAKSLTKATMGDEVKVWRPEDKPVINPGTPSLADMAKMAALTQRAMIARATAARSAKGYAQ